jgi:hypothetical protein
MMSAPRSPNTIVANGPARALVKSKSRGNTNSVESLTYRGYVHGYLRVPSISLRMKILKMKTIDDSRTLMAI